MAILYKFGVWMSFLPDTWWGHVGEVVITTPWVVGITNAFNFLDGMDGLATGSAGINALFFGLVALTDQPFVMLRSLALAGSCLGFLPWNFRKNQPARIFLGDGGSNFLGFTLAGIGVIGNWGENSLVGLAVPILILGVPIFDTTLTTVVRIKRGQVRTFGEWLRFTGRDHFHYRLSDLGIGNRESESGVCDLYRDVLAGVGIARSQERAWDRRGPVHLSGGHRFPSDRHVYGTGSRPIPAIGRGSGCPLRLMDSPELPSKSLLIPAYPLFLGVTHAPRMGLQGDS